MQGRIIKFQVKPAKWNPYKPPFRFYWNVHIFESKTAMWAAGAKVSACDRDKDGGYGALTVPLWRERYEGDETILAPKLGDVLFHRDCLGSSCVSHEAVHMSTSYLRRISKLELSEDIDDSEELLAYCIGGCTRQIVDKCYEIGLY
ncbi:MAG TPA: hypothetical protein V6C63_06550 [Allocoleopsis sp.]